ncbi:MAG: transcriptional repressor NrdR [Alphaproteobacteria bacterium]|jgi:transcriptional repressor NrdR|nr:transcriptional repressor NrdR [Alphaproteobacteria bacterium]MCB1551043.1 transcriptional repressor NrdR [Alphaproteobacteria bacterium]MCB9984598.1 transcriptional repressor NrdR [Micavibrio sp.]HRK97941.1 transcriptional regulator NrdR [Alphaproteobacteria bacterium]
MHCPFCGCEETQVKDSRPSEDGTSIRRRRACPECGARFTTFERTQLRELTVIKARDKRQPFDREKIIKSMEVALRKRPIAEENLERAVNGIVRQLEVTGENEVTSKQIGALVMQALMELDVIGYIRYASVYKDFSTPEDFKDFVKTLDQLI